MDDKFRMMEELEALKQERADKQVSDILRGYCILLLFLGVRLPRPHFCYPSFFSSNVVASLSLLMIRHYFVVSHMPPSQYFRP